MPLILQGRAGSKIKYSESKNDMSLSLAWSLNLLPIQT